MNLSQRQLVSALRRTFGEVPYQKEDDLSKGEVRVFCIYCPNRKGSPDRSGHLNLSVIRKTMHCYRCDAKGTLWAFLRDVGLNDLTWASTDLSRYAETITSWLDHEASLVSPEARVDLPAECKRLHSSTRGVIAQRALSYLKSRRISKKTIDSKWIGYCASGKFKGRIIFPVFDLDGKTVIYWTSRKFMFDGKKTLHPPVKDKKGSRTFFYNFDAIQGRKTAIICEGPLDVLRHMPNMACASLGSNLTFEHLHMLLKANFSRVFICWDPDAYVKAMATAKILNPMIPTFLVKLQDGDPNEVDRKTLRKALKSAQQYSFGMEIDEGW